MQHQFSIKYVRRDYHNDVEVHDSRIIVSSPLPSEIIRIDNTQRVMYKIDSPLTGVTTESIELSFRTSQPDGVIFYIRNSPIVTYFELVRGQPVVTIDTGYKNIYLRPPTPSALNDNQWHEVKLHRDAETISINLDSQHYDTNELGIRANILTGGYVYLGLADPNNINLSEKKTFVGEMVRGKVTINNIQQKVVQQPYYWPQTPSFTTNQTVSIDASQLTTSPDGKMINIVINVYGPPGFSAGVNGVATAQKTDADTHFIYLDSLPDTRYISVAPSDREIDFRVPGSSSVKSLDSFLIKFQTRQHCGQLVTLVNDRRNFIGLEIFDGYLYSSSSLNGAQQRYQISRVRVDDGRIYQINLKQEGQKLLCWLDMDDSYRQSIMYSSPIVINTIRVAGQDGIAYGFVSPNPFVGCIGSIIFNERDIIDYKYVPNERRQSCQNVVQLPIKPQPQTTPAPPPPPPASVSLGYISFQKPADIFVYNYIYDHEKPYFEDISFIFRTTTPNGVLFSAHNNENGQNPHLIGAYLKDGLVHVVYLNSSYTQELHFSNNPVDDGSLYRLNIRRNNNGHGFIQLQSYVGVTALDFYTQPGQIQFSKINVGGADEWSRIRYFGTRPDFNGCIIDLFQVNGNSVIKPADIAKERYNCNVEGPKQRPTPSRPSQQPTRRPSCLPVGYPLSFESASDMVTYTQSEPKICEHIHIPFRTRIGRGIIYTHYSEDGESYIIVYLHKGYVSIIVKVGGSNEKELKLTNMRVDDGELHKLDIHCERTGYLIAYIDQNRQAQQNHLSLNTLLEVSAYTIGYFNAEKLSQRYASLDNFRGCVEQITFNKECLIFETFAADRSRLSCSVVPAPPIVPQPQPPISSVKESTWRFRGNGELDFVPSLLPARLSELKFQFNTSRSDAGTIVCTRDEQLALKVELKDQKLHLSVFDAKSRRFIKAATFPSQRLNDNRFHRVQLIKKSRGVVTITLDENVEQTLQHDGELPFVNTRYGVSFGGDCVDNTRKFIGEINAVTYLHDGRVYNFDDLIYSEDPRLSYKSYVEFWPKSAEPEADPKPLHFRSVKSSARLDHWDSSKIGRISFDFKVDVNDNGVLFSTESVGSYFSVAINYGYLETTLSPRGSNAAGAIDFSYDQRLFQHPELRINDAQWHRLEFAMLGDGLASFVLDDDASAKIRFPMNYWTEDSALVFGNNQELKKADITSSFRGCIRNVNVNDRPINWAASGSLTNVQAGCYTSSMRSSGDDEETVNDGYIQYEKGACLKFTPSKGGNSMERETCEMRFKTNGGDNLVLLDSVTSDFIVHTQGPAVVVSSKGESNSANTVTVVGERDDAFNDNAWHRLKLEKIDTQVSVEIDGKYKQELVLSRSRTKIGQVHVGCSRPRQNKLRDFEGQLTSIAYNGIDLGQRLNEADPSLLVDGAVLWHTPSRPRPRQEIVDAVSLLRDASFVKLDRLNFDPNVNLSFSFRTNEPNGLLAYVSSGSNFLAIELVNGSLSLVTLFDRLLKRVSCSAKQSPEDDMAKFNDNRWHSVQIKRDRLGASDSGSTAVQSSITFACDQTFVRTRLGVEPKISSVSFSTGYVAGELPSDLYLARNPKYSGCLGDFRLNDRVYNLHQSVTSDSRQTLEKGCPGADSPQCSHSTRCQNQGECVEGFGARYSCNCAATSFMGEKCEQPASSLSFNGSHSIEYVLGNLKTSSAEDLSLRFRTRLRNGVLIALKKSAAEPSLIVSIEDGRVKCVYDRPNEKNDKVIYLGEVGQFNNNKWHTLILKRNGPNVQLEVLDSQRTRTFLNDYLGDSFIHVNYGLIDIGSVRSTGSSSSDNNLNFIGWLQNTRFNGDDLLTNHRNDKPPKWAKSVIGGADAGENSLLLHHAVTFTQACRFILPQTSASAASNEHFNIHLFVKTSAQNGVILYRRGRELRYMMLEVKQGRLRFAFSLGGGLQELVLNDVAVNDNNWHEVTVRRLDRSKFGLKVDEFKELHVDIGTQHPLLNELEAFNIGGVPEPSSMTSSQGFLGCLAALEINNDAPNLHTAVATTCPSVQRGCQDLSCQPDTCSNNGLCSVASGKVQCNCEMTSFTGPNCKDNSNYYFFGKDRRGCGLIKYSIGSGLGRNRNSDRMAFGFTTTNQQAILTRIEGDSGRQYIEIRLRDGYVQCAVNLNNFEETFTYDTDKKLNDNTYHVVQFSRETSDITVRVDNFDMFKYTLKASSNECVFRNEQFVFVGTVHESMTSDECYYGVISGMFFNGQSVLDKGSRIGDVGLVENKYVVIDIDINRNRTRPMMPGTHHCPLGYVESVEVCVFSICPLNSDQIADMCACYQGYIEIEMQCVKRNDTLPMIAPSNKYIPARTHIPETPIGLILGIISGILLALMAAAAALRKCCAAATVRPPIKTLVTTSIQTNEVSEVNIMEKTPFIQRKEEYLHNEGYYQPPLPLYTQSVNETMEMYETTVGGGGGATNVTTTYNTLSGGGHHHHHTSQRNLEMSSMFSEMNQGAGVDYELSKVTCLTMTPEGKYVIVGQSVGTPQIWDTLSGQLVRTLSGSCTNCTNLTLSCGGRYLVGLSSDVTLDSTTPNSHIQTLQIWDVSTDLPIQMSHQIKCCVFALSNDTNSIFMAGNQRFGQGISVGILDLVTFELTKEIKSDPQLLLGDPESIVITPDERHAVVGCRYGVSGSTNFVVFDLTKSAEIAQTKSITFNAEPKCIQVLNNAEMLTGSHGGNLLQWSIHTCQVTHEYTDNGDMPAHHGLISQIALTKSKEHVVSASYDGSAKVWNTNSKTHVSTLCGHRAEV